MRGSGVTSRAIRFPSTTRRTKRKGVHQSSPAAAALTGNRNVAGAINEAIWDADLGAAAMNGPIRVEAMTGKL